MRKILLFMMLIASAHLMAQDVIVKKDGSTIVSKVLEITPTEVKYKRFNNLQGPTYSVLISELQTINYENGEKETFGGKANIQQPAQPATASNSESSSLQNLSYEELTRLTEPVSKGKTFDDGSQRLEKKIRRLRLIGWLGGASFIATSAILIGAGVAENNVEYTYYNGYSTSYDYGDGEGLIIAGLVIAAAGGVWTTAFVVRANKLKRQSGLSLQSIPLYQYDIKFNNHSSLTAGIDMLRDNRFHDQTLGLGLRYTF